MLLLDYYLVITNLTAPYQQNDNVYALQAYHHAEVLISQINTPGYVAYTGATNAAYYTGDYVYPFILPPTCNKRPFFTLINSQDRTKLKLQHVEHHK